MSGLYAVLNGIFTGVKLPHVLGVARNDNPTEHEMKGYSEIKGYTVSAQGHVSPASIATIDGKPVMTTRPMEYDGEIVELKGWGATRCWSYESGQVLIPVKENNKALKEIEMVTKTCNTPEALTAGIDQVARKYAAEEKTIKTYPNGLKRVALVDRDGAIVGEYVN